MHGRRVLITGGAGFIGSHLADELLRRGDHVRALDNLTRQVHPDGVRPDYLDPAVELVVGDVRDSDAIRRALDRIDVVVHLAAAVGVGQSMYEIDRYTAVNTEGTAVLLQALIERRVERLVVASSMSIYGEGLYRTQGGDVVQPRPRDLGQLQSGTWELLDDGAPLVPVATPEWKTPSLESVYALTKFDQERMSLIVGQAYDIPTVALRFFNVYGTRQALSNPYTGVLAIFASRLLNRRPPLIYEDGLQRRDFVSVHDVVQACCLAMDSRDAAGGTFNVGSGDSVTVREVAERTAAALGSRGITPEITGRYRKGDIRHCFADITHARERLGYAPRVRMESGMVELAEWLATQVPKDLVAEASAELAARGLTVGTQYDSRASS